MAFALELTVLNPGDVPIYIDRMQFVAGVLRRSRSLGPVERDTLGGVAYFALGLGQGRIDTHSVLVQNVALQKYSSEDPIWTAKWRRWARMLSFEKVTILKVEEGDGGLVLCPESFVSKWPFGLMQLEVEATYTSGSRRRQSTLLDCMIGFEADHFEGGVLTGWELLSAAEAYKKAVMRPT